MYFEATSRLRRGAVRFLAPNTDEDDKDALGDEVAFEFEAGPEHALEESAGGQPAPQACQELNLQRSDSTTENALLSFHAESPFSHIAVPTFDSNNDLPSIHEVLDSHGSPSARINDRSGDIIIPEHIRTGSTASLVPHSNSWNGSPTVQKKSPLESSSNLSPYTSSAFSPSSSLNPRWPVNNAYEARLFHHYIVFCTTWIDVCDSRRHFEKDVPKRAAHFPVILHGILGLAARHLWLMGKAPEDYSQPYVDKCLQALIVALEDPLAHWDENFLVAVILLRLHEEMGDADEQCHHFGTARILNSISSFAADGGLRESASWVSLRQHIYVSLTTQQPVNLSLENYRHSSVFREYDDEAWANRIIFLFGSVLQCVFEDTSANCLNRDKWGELDAEVDEWERTKPWTFSALNIEPNAGESYTGSWPELPCAQGVVAVGLQYYHLCKILLTVYSPHASLVGLAGVRARKATDATIRKHIRITIGYGVSNSNCGNAMFQGSHILSACGAYIVDEKEQAACVEYLISLQTSIGWRTDKVLADLREQWST